MEGEDWMPKQFGTAAAWVAAAVALLLPAGEAVEGDEGCGWCG